MGTIKIGDSMSEDFQNATREGIEAATFCTLAEQNLNKNYFPKQAARYYDEMCKFISEDPNVPFISKLKFLLSNGLTPEQVQSYLAKNIVNMDPDRFHFVANSLSNTSKCQNRLKAKVSNSFQVVNGGVQKVKLDRNNRAA